MTYFPHSEKDINEMLDSLNISSLNDLKKPIPDKFHIKNLELPSGKTELETEQYFNEIADMNIPYKSIFLGAGAYSHYIPSAVDELSSRQEFYTAYTPYQAEISQGTLQAIFEYQTYMTRLTGLDVSNASMYDGATALCEAVIMAQKTARKNKVLIDKYIHPEYLETLKTYLNPLNIQIDIYNSDPFNFNINDFKTQWSNEYACFVISSPNFCGSIMDFSSISEIIHNDKGLLIQSVHEALSLAVLKSPQENGVDIVTGDCQSFGLPISFGGPYLGFLVCKKELLRKMPGRIVGQTTDKDGKTVYILTLSAREQHIRREGATSNICSNHSLCALRACIYLSVTGEAGLVNCAEKNIKNAQYLYNEINKLENFTINKNQIFFNEFAVTTDIDYSIINKALEQENILSFYPLNFLDPKLEKSYLVTSTEINTKQQIDNFISTLGRLK